MEFKLREFCDLCESSKKSERSKGVRGLQECLIDSSPVRLLRSKGSQDAVNWTVLFKSANKAILLESNIWKAEESKGAAPTGSRENSKQMFVSVVETIIKKSNFPKPSLYIGDILEAVFTIFEDKYLFKTFGHRFLGLLRDHVLPYRKLRTSMKHEDWNRLFLFMLSFLKKDKEEMKSSTTHCVLCIMDLLLCYGCPQSHMGLSVKSKLLPVFKAKFSIFHENAAYHETLLSLAYHTCVSVAKESRTGVCNFGELILSSVLKMYDPSQEDANPLNKYALDFMLLQVQCHHPDGAKEGSGGAYACDWRVWKRHLYGMYRAVFSAILKKRDGRFFSDTSLDLCTELCYQVLDKTNSLGVGSMILTEMDEADLGPAFKRRKVVTNTNKLFEELQGCKKDVNCCGLIALVTKILQKYPAMFEKTELQQLLDITLEMQSNCKREETMKHIFRCTQELLLVMSQEKLSIDLWQKVWDATLRLVGSNQKDGHSLLQTFITENVASSAGLLTLLRMFQSSLIQPSNQSLQTLIVLLAHYHLPESPCSTDIVSEVSLGEFPISAARLQLLTWLCSSLNETKVDMQLLAKALLLLVMKLKYDLCEIQGSRLTYQTGLKESSLVADHRISAFENGLLLPPQEIQSSSNMNKIVNYSSSRIIDSITLNKLELHMKSKYVELKDRFDKLQKLEEGTGSSQRVKNLSNIPKLKSELICDTVDFVCLSVNLLSGLVDHGAYTIETFENVLLSEGLQKSMQILKMLVPEVLKAADANPDGAIVANTQRTHQVLQSLRCLFRSNLIPSVNFYLRSITCQEILISTNVLFTTFPIEESSSEDLGNASCTASQVLQDITIPCPIAGSIFTDVDYIHFSCLDILIHYGCSKKGNMTYKKQRIVLDRILKDLSDHDIFDLSSESTFVMVYHFISTMLLCEELDTDKDLKPIVKLLQSLCVKWNQDAEVSSFILLLLKDVFKHAAVAGRVWEQVCSIKLLAPFRNKKFGPKFTVQIISCFEELLKVDKDFRWARWENATDLRQIVDSDAIPSEALHKFQDDRGRIAVVEETILFLLSPFHEVRLAVVSAVASLFKDYHRSSLWITTMFERLTIALYDLFIVKEENMSCEEIMDEGSNRTATVLHVLVAIIASSTKCYEQATLLIFRFFKEKNLDSGLVKKIFNLLAEALGLADIQKFLVKSLAFILDKWLQWGYQLQEFPFFVLNSPSLPDFINSFQRTILPVVWRNKNQTNLLNIICQQIKHSSVEVFEMSFASIYAQHLSFLVNNNIHSETATKYFESHASQVGKEKMKLLILSSIDQILIEVVQLVWDPSHHKELLSLDSSFIQAKIPSMTRDNFSSAVRCIEKAIESHGDLLVYLGKERPSIIQAVLLHLREDMSIGVTLDQKIKALHRYSIFAHAVACCMESGDCEQLTDFLLSDISHTLLYLIQENQKDPLMLDVCLGSLSFLQVLYDQLLPVCAMSLSCLLPTIVGSLIWLAMGNGQLVEKSYKILKMLIISKKFYLKEAIGRLPPFPKSPKFEDFQAIHDELKYQGQVFTLEEEIDHFLKSVGCSTILANQNSMFDGLYFLRQQLSNKKDELSVLYQRLQHSRGFSQDCKISILHQLICTLTSFSSSNDKKVQLEASRCLGELGPADLMTLVLRPIEGCINLVRGFSDPMMCAMALAVHCLSECLLDHDVCVVKTASCALLKLMDCKGSNSLHSNDIGSMRVSSKKISPFIPKQAAKSKLACTSDSSKIDTVLRDDELWCPGENLGHKRWVTHLSCSLFECLSNNDVFKDLSALCKVKTSFAEEMLPVLFYLGLSYSRDVCHRLCARLAMFFENHYANMSSVENSQASNFFSSTTNIYLNKASVQCMLNVVNYVRLQKSALSDQHVNLELNYFHVASAAQFCCAYLSSVMYLELWSNSEKRDLNFDGTEMAFVDYMAEMHPEDGAILQSLLTKAYEEIGDYDALYGCSSSVLQPQNTKVNQYEYLGHWDKVLLKYDVKLPHAKDMSSAKGLVNALQHSGLVYLQKLFLESLPSEQKELLLPAQLECMWRLNQWDNHLLPSNNSFEWNQYSALLAYKNGHLSSIDDFIMEGRLCVLNDLANTSLEICKNIYKPLAQFQALQELEDFSLSGLDITGDIISKWENQSTLPHADIFLVEPILAQRAKLLEILISQTQSAPNKQINHSYLMQMLTQHYLDSAKLARKEEQGQMAEQWLHALSVLPHESTEKKWQLALEDAQLAWASSRASIDGMSSIARKGLKSLLKELQASDSSRMSKIHPQALVLYGKWMAASHSENPQQIIENYLEEALQLLNNLPTNDSIQDRLEAHSCLAQFADLEYQRLTTYTKSESFQKKVNCMRSLSNDAKEVQASEFNKNSKEHISALRLSIRSSALDQEEIQNTYADQKKFFELAMRHYLTSMKLGTGDNVPVFKMVSLWLGNANHHDVNQLIISELDSISTYKFVELLPQLAARVGDNMADTFTKAIYKLLFRCCVEHPHHTLPLILALANSYEDLDREATPDPEPRVFGAKNILKDLQRNKSVNETVAEMDKVAKALISLAYAEVPPQRSNEFRIPKGEKILQLRNLHKAMLPIIHLSVQSDKKYPNIIGISSFKDKYTVAGGINRPKKIVCIGTDGVERSLLVKGKDDLRQDAVMQQVFGIMNSLLQTCKDTKRHRLTVRTYKIVPLSQRCGVLEWCENTSPLQTVLQGVHSKYYKDDWKDSVCSKKIQNAREKSNGERLKVFKDICKNFHPAFRFFFTEKFPNPAEWFDHRLAYMHSVATNSMVGYILGLGDRHVSNILIDKSTAEMIHIDFGIAFEQGKTLPTPETVPFRLTRDLVDGMGVYGVEGIFRRSCEKTMTVLRKNQEKIVTILEVLLYDPLYAWALTPKMAAKRQKGNNSTISSVTTDSGETASHSEKNKMAERALGRVKEKLQGTEEGPASSIEGQVNRLIQQARNPANLSRLYMGWQAFY